MNDNRGQTIFLSVIGIATLLVAIIGATFAYFTTTMSGTAQDVTAKTAELPTITFTTPKMELTNIFPGKAESRVITIESDATSNPVDFDCELNVTGNAIDDFYVTSKVYDAAYDGAVTGITEPSGAVYDKITATATYPTATKINTVATGAAGAGTVKLASGTIANNTNTKNVKHIEYTLTFKETGTNQDTQQGKEFAATVYCKLSGGVDKIYYTDTKQTGSSNSADVPGFVE